MTSRRAAQCGFCAHFRSPLDMEDPDGPPTCSAFPAGIPDEIWWGQADHRQPFDGDGGIRWKSDDDAEFPQWAVEVGGLSSTHAAGAALVGEQPRVGVTALVALPGRQDVRPRIAAVVRDELALLHLPGEHDQSSHGRKGVAVLDPIAALPMLTRDPSVSVFSHITDDAHATNPKYGEPQFDNNCVHVVSAYELRRRGFDATASPLPTVLGDNGRNAQEALERWVLPDGSPHGRTISVHSGVPVRDVIATTEAWPDGARGWITFSYDPRYSGGGHIFNVEKIDGEVIYVDAQTSEPYLDLRQVIRRSKEAGEAPVWGVARVDDLEPTDAVMEFIEPGGGS